VLFQLQMVINVKKITIICEVVGFVRNLSDQSQVLFRVSTAETVDNFGERTVAVS
jgi:hypothetical protein